MYGHDGQVNTVQRYYRYAEPCDEMLSRLDTAGSQDSTDSWKHSL